MLLPFDLQKFHLLYTFSYTTFLDHFFHFICNNKGFNPWANASIFKCCLHAWGFSPLVIVLLFWTGLLLFAEKYDYTEKNDLEKICQQLLAKLEMTKSPTSRKKIKRKRWRDKKLHLDDDATERPDCSKRILDPHDCLSLVAVLRLLAVLGLDATINHWGLADKHLSDEEWWC